MSKVGDAGIVPLRKSLAKKLINYYDELKNKNEERAASRSKSRGRTYEPGPDVPVYRDEDYRRRQLTKVKRVMSREYEKNEKDGVLDYEDVQFNKLHHSQQRSDEVVGEFPLALAVSLPIKQHIKERLLDEYDEDDDERPSFEEDDEETKKKAMFDLDLESEDHFKDPDDKKVFDHHLRKSKEIRRIQYSADRDLKNREKLAKAQHARELELIRKEYAMSATTEFDPTMRSDPKKRFPIWTVVNGVSTPSFISSPRGFALTEDGDNIEINEEDIVYVEPKNHNEFRAFSGKVTRSESRKYDCDFIVTSPSTGQSYPIQIVERMRKRKLASSNCTIIDSEGRLLGRAFIELVYSKSFSKAVEVTKEGNTSVILAKTDRAGYVQYRDFEGEKEIKNKDKIVQISKYSTYGMAMKRIELEPKLSKDDPEFPRELYLFGKSSQVENTPLFQNELARLNCENGIMYEGTLKVRKLKGQEDYGLWILAEKSNQDVHGTSMNNSKLYQSVNLTDVEPEELFIELDEKADLIEIDQALEQVEKVGEQRAKDREVKLLNKSRRGGRRRSHLGEDVKRSASPITQKTKTYQSTFLDREVPEKGFTNKESDVQRFNNRHQSEFKPRSNKDSKITGPTRAEEITTTPFSAPTKKNNQLNKGFLETTTFKSRKSEHEQLRESEQNFKMKLDVANQEFNRVDMEGNVNIRFGKTSSPMTGFDGMTFKKVKLTDQIKQIKDKALRDIQIYFKYKLNKPKFSSQNAEKLPTIRKKLSIKGQYLTFIKFFLDLPSRVSISDAFKSFVQVM